MLHAPFHSLRILVTQADVFMGPDLCAVLSEQGATVIADSRAMADPLAVTAALADAGEIDVLVVNLAVPAPASAATEVTTFAAYLCSDAANCFVGQVFPVCGGWVNR